MRFNIIGAGRLGKNLALSLIAHGHQLIAVCNRSLPSALDVLDTLNAGEAVSILSILPEADFTFITTPDGAIAAVAEELAALKWLTPNHLFIHCSGVLSSDVLMPLRERGVLTASLHPLKAFRRHDVQKHGFADCFCVIEGDDAAITHLTAVFEKLHARLIPLDSKQKHQYHAAAVMASNYVVTLAHAAQSLFVNAGIEPKLASTITFSLMQSSFNNLHTTQHYQEALTGPLARGDLDTVHLHLQAITPPELLQLYRSAAITTLDLTHLPAELKHQFRALLEANHDDV